ncbi:Anp1-domain-containing protein [Chlamydoabsidia padenii]|nr:Anp1-domain-containing protein [Chlamydoabsidia padenii]
MSSLSTFRVRKRLALTLAIVTCIFLYAFYHDNLGSTSNINTTCHNTRSLESSRRTLSWKGLVDHVSQPYHRDLNTLNATSSAIQNQERILVLTPLLKKNAVDHLERYFDLLDKSTYPNHLISIGLLIPSSSEEQEKLKTTLTRLVNRIQRRWFHAFHEITIYQRDFNFDFDPSQQQQQLDHYKLAPYRRSMMARARNYLLSAALQDDHSWVTWMNVDVYYYPTTIFEDLIRYNVDVIVPNGLLATEDGTFWAYERNNWQETDMSMRFQMEVGDDFVMLEGYNELATGRTLLVDMPTHQERLVPLDGVGASFTLVKAQVHREGANFPSYTYQHQVDTEGFARMVQAMGCSIFGLPSYFVYHARS